MARLAAFLRAVNVGGTGKLPMVELKAMCEELGFSKVQTYIASGNVVFETKVDAEVARKKLLKRLERQLGKAAEVFMRDAAELQALIDENPFLGAEGARHMVILLLEEPTSEMITTARLKKDEVIKAGSRALHVHYPSGMGVSKLKIPGAEKGTARNMNTIRKMLELVRG
jgi:uncharacterized protein (DUF1697 family)